MSQWDKLLDKILDLSGSVRFEEIKKLLERYGYESINTGGSHYVFRKTGCTQIAIPRHSPVKKAYLRLIRDIVMRGENDD